MALLRQSPRDWGFKRSRWRLQDVLVVVGEWLNVSCVSALWRVLKRLDISYRHSWAYAVSPDPFATEKLAWIDEVCEQAQAHPDQVLVLWLDELTVYQSPSEAPVWGASEGRARKAIQATKQAQICRIVGTLSHTTGEVRFHARQKVGVKALCQFYAYLRQEYPNYERIYVIQDCCPTHFHDKVCAAADKADITMVPLPTYSSWRNPIEQLWRWLKQDVLHMHPWHDNWNALKQAMRDFLKRFRQPNQELLHYVGLS